MKKVLSILVVVLALTLALGCFAYADEFVGEAEYEVEAYGYTEADVAALVASGNFKIDDWNDPNMYTAPTCVDKGWARLHCINDNTDLSPEVAACVADEYYRVWIDPDGIHDYTILVEDKAPTCAEDGVGHHICKDCGKSDNISVKLPATGAHKFGKWIVEKPATCLYKGLQVRICNVCKLREEKDIDPTGHYDGDKDGKADPEMYDKSVLIKPYHDATTCYYGTYKFTCPWCKGLEQGADKNGFLEAYVSGDIDVESNELPWMPQEHTWGTLIEDPPATCTDNGGGYHQCVICGVFDYEFDVDGDKVDDNLRVDYDDDGSLDDASEVLKYLGHTFSHTLPYLDIVNSVPPTCKNPGYSVYVCTRCFAPSGINPTLKNNLDYFVAAEDYDGLIKADAQLAGFPNFDPNNYDWAPSWADPAKQEPYQTAIEIDYFEALGHDWYDWVCVTEPGQAGNINGYWTRNCKRPGCLVVEDFTGTQAEFDAMIAGKEAEAHANDKNGLVCEDGEWKLYKDDVFQSDYVGMVKQDGNDFFVADGKVCMDANGLNLYNGEWYFLSLGRVCKEHTGFAEYDGCWFFITDGKLDTSKTGLYDYNGGTFVFAEGRLIAEYSGLYFDGTDWYFAANGQIQKDFSGAVEYDGETFFLENGKLVG